jgi:hypothetical protein
MTVLGLVLPWPPLDASLAYGGPMVITCTAALVAFGLTGARSRLRWAAGAFLCLVFLCPFVTVGVQWAMGADPLATFLTGMVLFAALLFVGVCVMVTAAVATASRSHRQRRQAVGQRPVRRSVTR